MDFVVTNPRHDLYNASAHCKTNTKCEVIAQTNFNYPRQWKLDAKELAAGMTLREKEDIRAKKLRQESLKVSTYNALGFKNLQQHSTIWLPYNFE